MSSETQVSKTRLYLKVLLFFALVMTAGFFLLVAFVGGIIGAFATGNYLLVVGGVFFFILFAVFMTFAKKFEPAWREYEELKGTKRKTTRESIKESLPLIGMMVMALVLAPVFEEYFLGFPGQITGTLGREILDSILTIDGIIMGLCGVVVAQILWAVHSKGNILFEQMITNYKDKNVAEWLQSELDSLRRVRFGTVFATSFLIIPPLASFLICLSRLPLTEGVAFVSPRTLLYDPITVMVVAVIGLIWITSQVSLLPNKLTFPQSKPESTDEDELGS